MLVVDPALFDYCTDREREVLEVYHETNSGPETAARFGLHRSYPGCVLRRVMARAARRGYAPGHFTDGVAPGYAMGKVTIQRGPTGAVERVWERQSPEDAARMEALQAAADAMCEAIVPVSPIAAPEHTLDKLATLYTFTDYHLGALAWHKEGGADWDLDIAETLGIQAMQSLVASAPASHRGIVNVQGDFLHFDGFEPVTPTHGHILDADGRFSKVIDVAISLIRHLVALALQKHQHVDLLIAEGNHDEKSSLWLRKMFALLYADEPRVTVATDELPYYVIQHGETMLGFHHGHKLKNDQLPLFFAAQFPNVWGATRKRYAHTGHRHHVEEKEHRGMIVVQHPTLAARDAYAARGGWISERAATAITYDARHGKVASNTVTPEMFA